jgi:hypothetical protein
MDFHIVKMPVKASAEKRELILKIDKYFGAESKRKAPFYAWNKVIDRTVCIYSQSFH